MGTMKILCVIDSLGSGGAQRQMVNLACGLKAKGHDVQLLVYFPELSFFHHELDAAGIFVHQVSKKEGFYWQVVAKITDLFRTENYDTVISFLDTPNVYCELAKAITFSRHKLIVSERSTYTGESGNLYERFKRYFHVLADTVVANSYTHGQWLQNHLWLKHKTKVIYNGYPIVTQCTQQEACQSSHFNYLIVGRVDAGKNGVRIVHALIEYYQKHGNSPSVAWAGRQEKDPQSLSLREEMDLLLAQNPVVGANWHWLGERNDIPQLLVRCDALIHASMYEGLPNVVCEAFIACCPVIASNVCDHPLLVEDGIRGILCDPLLPSSICAAIERFESMSVSERNQITINARKYAEENLSLDKMVSQYESLL